MSKLGDGYWAGKRGAAPIEAQHFEHELFLQTLDQARGQQTYVSHNALGCVSQNHVGGVKDAGK